MNCTSERRGGNELVFRDELIVPLIGVAGMSWFLRVNCTSEVRGRNELVFRDELYL
jgi:hypothetical protein